MTLDDLLETFRNHPTTREGVKAVVEALRDEVLQSPALEDEGMVTVVDDLFDKILASDGLEAAGASTRKDGVGRPDTPLDTPAADVWQPMATAPRDGTEFVAYLPWVNKRVLCHWDKSARRNRGPGWVCSFNEYRSMPKADPSCWHPLPDLPAAAPVRDMLGLTEADHRHLQYKHWGIGYCDCKACKEAAR